jgi:putative Mg2+ transporter-C (MgtC) family protein
VDLSGDRLLYINLEIYNKQGVKGVIIVDAVRQIDGVNSVDIS